MTKKERLEAIIAHYGDGKPSQFAKLIGVAPSTISSWLARDTFDYELLFAKCENINPLIIENYTGDDIIYDGRTVLGVKENPELKNYNGKTIITTDGTTLLGADDKAGIAEIMGMVEYFSKTNEPHGDIYIAFTPDEEIGKSVDYLDRNIFNPKYAYTVDGEYVGEISYEKNEEYFW